MKTGRGRTRAFLGALLVAASLLPTLTVAQRAFADGDDEEEEAEGPSSRAGAGGKISDRRAAVLGAMTTNETVLINVTGREMPASPDVLNLGRKSTRALARCVSDNVDDGVRTLCAELLGRLGDRGGLGALQGALEAWDPAVRGAAIRALANMPDPSSVEPLRKIVVREDEEESNREAALLTLGALSDTKAMRIVRDAFVTTDPKQKALRPVAFNALWKSRHLMARSTLIQDVDSALKSDDAALVLPATFAASELRAPALRDALIHLMSHADARIRNRAVYAVGKVGDKAATSALLAFVPKVRESRMLNNIAFALERLDPSAFYETARGLATHTQAQIRMNTAFVLGDVKRPEGLPLLKGALDDKNEAVKLNAVRAIGKLDAPSGAALLERYVDDPNQSLRSAAIYAIFALSGMKRTDLVRDKLYASDKPAVKLEAAIALGRAGDSGVAGDLMTCVEANRCSLGEVAGFLRSTTAKEVPGRTLLAWSRGRTDLTDLVAELRPPGAGALAVSDVQASMAHASWKRAGVAIDLAGDLSEPSALAVLKPLLTHESTSLRLHASVALSRAGDADAGRVLLADMDNLPHERLGLLVRLMSRIVEAPARARFTPELIAREKGGDPAIAIAAAAVRLAWDPEGAIFRMLDALASPSRLDRDLAEAYLRRNRRPIVTSLLRRALARETRDNVRDRLRRILDIRDGHDDAK